MRYAVVSDIHANLQAWNAVLLDVRAHKLDRIICLGDLVGYGPNPAEVLQSVYANVDLLVLGNHDAAACGMMEATLFNEQARRILFRTRKLLNAAAMRFLRSLPLSLDGGFFRCAHGDFSEPAAFRYVIDPADAVASWNAVEHPLLFVGHAHRPAIFVLGASKTPHMVEPQDFQLEAEKRFLVSVPSVGQPRDGRAMAAYCILDDQARTVCWRDIPFDLDAYRRAVTDAGIPPEASYFLQHDPRRGTPPLRELLSFSPAATPEQAVRDAVEVRDLTALRRGVRRWKTAAAAGLSVAVAAAVLSGTAWWRHAHRGLVIPDPAATSLVALSVPPKSNILGDPPPPSDAGRPIPGWRISLGDRQRQGVWAERTPDGRAALVLRSGTAKDEMLVASPPVSVKPGMRLGMEASFLKSKGFDGNVAAVITLTRTAGKRRETVDQFVVKEPSVDRQGGWAQAKQSFATLAGATSVSLQIRGRFVGEVRVADVSLCRKE